MKVSSISNAYGFCPLVIDFTTFKNLKHLIEVALFSHQSYVGIYQRPYTFDPCDSFYFKDYECTMRCIIRITRKSNGVLLTPPPSVRPSVSPSSRPKGLHESLLVNFFFQLFWFHWQFYKLKKREQKNSLRQLTALIINLTNL